MECENGFNSISRSRTAESYTYNSMFNFLRNSQTVFHSCCTMLTFPPLYKGFQFIRMLFNLLVLFTKVILEGVKWCSTVVFSFCISLMTNVVEYFFICIHVLEKDLSNSCSFVNWVIFIVSFVVLYIFWIQVPLCF